MRSLARRSTAPELMDTEPVSFEEFSACLRDLEWLNRRTFAYAPTLTWLSRIARPGRPISILDVGSGRGDMLRRIEAWSRRAGVEVELTGVDLNPWSARAAREATPPGLAIRYETADVFALPERPVDIVVSSIFAHHLADEDLVRFLRWMQGRARLGWFVNDLHRHAVPYLFLRGLFALAPFHRFVVHDGPVSVARAFTRADWEGLIAAAAIQRSAVEVRWHAPFRWGVGTRV